MAKLIGFIFLLIACRPSKSRIKADNFTLERVCEKGRHSGTCKADSCRAESLMVLNTRLKIQNLIYKVKF